MLTQDDVERRLAAGLCFPAALAEPRKWAFASAVAAFDKAGARHAIAGDLCLHVRGVSVEHCQLEFAVDRIPRAELEAESFVVEGDACRRQGVEIRLRVVKPAVLGRIERFGKLALLGAADALRGKVEDACSPGISSAARAAKIAEAESLSLALPDAAEEVVAKPSLSRAAKANDNWVADPGGPEGKTMPVASGQEAAPAGQGVKTAPATVGQEIYRWIGKVLGLSALVLTLVSMPACQLDASGLGSQTLGAFCGYRRLGTAQTRPSGAGRRRRRGKERRSRAGGQKRPGTKGKGWTRPRNKGKGRTRPGTQAARVCDPTPMPRPAGMRVATPLPVPPGTATRARKRPSTRSRSRAEGRGQQWTRARAGLAGDESTPQGAAPRSAVLNSKDQSNRPGTVVLTPLAKSSIPTTRSRTFAGLVGRRDRITRSRTLFSRAALGRLVGA